MLVALMQRRELQGLWVFVSQNCLFVGPSPTSASHKVGRLKKLFTCSLPWCREGNRMMSLFVSQNCLFARLVARSNSAIERLLIVYHRWSRFWPQMTPRAFWEAKRQHSESTLQQWFFLIFIDRNYFLTLGLSQSILRKKGGKVSTIHALGWKVWFFGGRKYV